MSNFIIPGLTDAHFKCGSVTPAPAAVSLKTGSKVNRQTGGFHFMWTARESNGESYRLSAEGNIFQNAKPFRSPGWWGFKCSCTCRQIPETLQTTERDLIVCKHLYAALSSVVDPSANKPAAIVVPGLTNEHFINGGFRIRHEPILIKAKVHKNAGHFHLEWKATGTHGKTYKLWAKGNILRDANLNHRCPNWWGFRTHCSCVNYWKQVSQTLSTGHRKNYVCKHLATALSQVVDGSAERSYNVY
jgi:hypothetical protein